MNKAARIFIVEDDPAYAIVLEHHLQSLGYTDITRFGRGEECLDHLDKNPDIILLDFSLEGLNGLDTLKAIRKAKSRAKVSILTALESKEMKRECEEFGADEYILKGNDATTKIAEFVESAKSPGIPPIYWISGIVAVIAILTAFYFLFLAN